MKQSIRRWTALVLALVMTASLIPGVSLPAAAEQATVGTLDHTDIISLPITIRNHSADGMLFEWDGLGENEYEEKPFRNPYNTSDITEPIPFVGVNLAVGQLFCNDWDLSNLNKNGIQYHYGETYDSRYAHIAPGSGGWHEYDVWNRQVDNPADTQYMIIRFRTDGFGTDKLFVKRYTNNGSYFQAGVDLGVRSADGPYTLVGTEDGWTTISVDLNDSRLQSDGAPSSPVTKISIGFNGDHQLDVSFVAFFIRLLDNQGEVGEYDRPFRFCGYDFINQDYCFRMDDPTITVVEPRPAIGINLLLDRTTANLSVAGTGAQLTNHASADTEPGSDWDKYITISAGSEPATATLWTSSSSEESYPSGMARYAALRCKADFNAELTILANGSEVVTSFNPATVTEGGDVLDVQTDTTTENGATVTWKTVIIDTHYDGSVVSMELRVPAGKSLDLAYAGLFRNYDPTFTSGYNYATDARVFVFEDYSYRHDRIAYYTPIERYKVWRDNSETNSVVHFKDNDGASFDPNAVVNIEHSFYAGGTLVSPPNAVNGTVQLVTDDNNNKYMRLTDSGSERGIGLRSILMTGVNKPANQLRYAVVSYKVESKGSAKGDTVPMYVMLDTAGSGFNYETVTLGFFDAVADGRWHVDVLDLSECVSRAPNGETYQYKHDTFTDNSNIQRIGIADGWAVYGAELHLAYLALFDSAKKAEQYGNAYSEAYKSVRNFPTSETGAASFAVMTNAYTAILGQKRDELYKLNNGQKEYWESLNGSKRFRVGSNNGFELLDPDYAYNNNSFYHANTNGYDSSNQKYVPNYYKDLGFGEYVKNNSTYTNYNVGPNGQLSYYNDDHRRDISSTNGASGIWGKSVDTYGYIMGLTERQLAEVGDQKYIRYRQEVVEYLAQLLQNALNVPRTFMWYDIQFYSANYVQGDVDGDRFGYYDEQLEDGSENVNAMFPRDYAGWLRYKLGVTNQDGSLTGSRGELGSWELTEPKGEDLIADREEIATWTDAAYYMLNTLFLPSAGEEVPEYKYLQLVRETPTGGSAEDSYYVFDTRYTNIMFDFDKGVIGNNSPNVNYGTSIKDTTNGQVATYAFLPILRELPEFQSTFPYLRDTGIANKDDGAESYYNRDYNFTLECHGTFTYYADKDLFFEFDGDDDVYLYVNNTCVLDLGGAHRATNQLVKINDYVSKGILNLEENTEYPFDFYFMERHGTGSNLRIQTNMEVFSNDIATEKTASQTIDGVTTELPDYSMADFTQPVSYSFAITNNFDPAPLKNFSFKDSDIGFYAGFDSVNLGEVTPGTSRRLSELSVSVKDQTGSVVFGPQTPANADQLRQFLTDPGSRGGLAYGETLILSGVKYVIGEGHSAFANTVISRAGKHSGVAYHHLLNQDSANHYFAWSGHTLTIPIEEILGARAAADTGDWSDIYLCSENLNAAYNSAVTVDHAGGVVRLNYESTGSHRLNFTSSTINGLDPYPISVDVYVLDVPDNVYVLDFDGSTKLGKDNENNDQYSFARNDVYALPGARTKVRYEALTDAAPVYANNRLSFGENGSLWPKQPDNVLTVVLGANLSSTGGARTQTLVPGSAIRPVTVLPVEPTMVVPAPTITGSGVSAEFVPAEQIMFFNLSAVSWWQASGCIQYARFVSAGGDKNVKLVKIADNIWACQVPGDANYTKVQLRRMKEDMSGDHNHTGEITIPSDKNYLSSFSENGTNGSWSVYTGTHPFGYYVISGKLDSNVTVTFGAAAEPSGVSAPVADGDPVILAEAPYYHLGAAQYSGAAAEALTAPVEYTAAQGVFTVKLPADGSTELPVLNFRPDGIMDGASSIWLTSRVWEDKTGVTPTAYLGNADPHKEVEMFQCITVVPANVVYYEDANTDIIYNSQSEAGKPTVSWTHELNNDGSSTTAGTVPSPDQSANQGTAYGWDSSYVNGTMGDGFHNFSGNSSTKITFRGTVKLAEFNFTGIGFDLFSRTETNGPTVIAKIFNGETLVKTVYVATEFTNAGITGNNTDEAIYQVPVLSVQGLARENYRVELEGIGRVNMAGWSIVTRDGKYYLVGTEDGEEVEYEIILPAPGSGEPVKYQKAGSAPTSLHPATEESHFWLDGLRVYGALDAADQNTYYTPGEANAAFVPVRDLLTTGKGMAVNYTGTSTNITYGNFTTTVEIHNKPNPDGFALNNNAEANLAYYFLVGPNNELYLNGSGDKLQAAVFTLKSVGNGAKTFQVAAKLLDSNSFGNSGSSAKLFYLVTDTAPNTYRWEELATVQSGTELYYELDPSRCPQSGGSYTVIIGTGADSENTSSSMVALTRVKYKGWEFQTNYSTEMNFIRDENGVIIGITENGNNMLGNLMRLLSSATHLKPSHPFADVASGAWYADAVAWAYSEGITSGTAADAFSPNRASSRAQVVSFLWNAAGRPEAQQPADFADVPADAWYAKAVAWAVENGITAGTSDTSFSPYEPCTRAQAATFLWRYAGSPNAENGSGFDDVAADAWYARAVAWAVEHGITTGTGANRFSPSRICTRAQIVTFLYRHAEFENGGNP